MRGSWFEIAESALGLTLLVVLVIKILADGFTFTMCGVSGTSSMFFILTGQRLIKVLVDSGARVRGHTTSRTYFYYFFL
jgi:hypothetical protein